MADSACDNLGGIIAGCVGGTALLCCLIFGIVIHILIQRNRKLKLKYYAQSVNGIDRRQSTVANVEGGIHNTAYMGDSLDSSDVIMMMDSSKKNGSAVSNAKNGKNGDMSSSLKGSSGIGSDVGVSPNSSSSDDQSKGRRFFNSLRRRHRNNSATLNRQIQDLECVEAELIGKNVSGLGFDVKGNPRDGISISNIHDRGAARENSLINVGDKVLSLAISFDHMVYEDALTLLSYASPYPITLLLGKKRKANRKGSKKGRLSTPKSNKNSNSQMDLDIPADIVFDKADSQSDVNSESHGKRDDQSENGSHNDEMAEDQGIGDDEISYGRTDMNDNEDDDDTRRRAPTHLPKTIIDLVESKKSGQHAVETIEDHTRDKVITPDTPDGNKSFSLSFGAQSALDRILSGDELSDDEEDKN